MPLPNLNSPTKVEGKNVLIADVPTTASGILVNPSGSNKTLKLSSYYVSNIDGTNACDITSYIFDNSTSATGYLANTISVPSDASLLPLTKDSNIYIMENQTLFARASASGDLSIILSYEEIS
ncbi:hypothetical protein EBZ39_03360 [bacterium]|nr:hypothetical protein [bacterium]